MRGALLLLLALGCGAPKEPAAVTEPAVPYALETRRWQARPLLVFAPSADDPRLHTQLASVDAARAAMAEREMDDVRIVGEQGQANGAAMPASEALALRARFEVDAAAFAVVLVGKDGGEKFRAPAPVPMPKVFEIIDAMPMRREEMRAR